MSHPPEGTPSRLPLPPALPALPTVDEAREGWLRMLERGGLAAAYRAGAETRILRVRPTPASGPGSSASLPSG